MRLTIRILQCVPRGEPQQPVPAGRQLERLRVSSPFHPLRRHVDRVAFVIAEPQRDLADTIGRRFHVHPRGLWRHVREIDLVVVKGKTEPVGVYEVLEFHTPDTFPNLNDAMGHFRDGVERYRDGAWDDAIARFHKVLKANPQDRLSEIYVDRCEHYKVEPPAADWGGVWTMTSK